ncbi:MAG: DUF3793 family protein [Eubacteriales bacterium]|nr:DUF3793 family protein [Eubacteriales bacterium]
MSDKMLIDHCSPTLAGLKTGSMFSCTVNSMEELYSDIRKANDLLVDKGIRVLPLKYYSNRMLIYVYRPEKLELDLKNSLAKELLLRQGYDLSCPERSVIRLIERLNEKEGFPHEVGLFLSYPPEDVDAFINNKAEGFKAVGCWKVYNNVDKALKTFEKYKKCTDVYVKKFSMGNSVYKLAVSSKLSKIT